MRHEKAFVLPTGRLVKVIITSYLAEDLSKVSVEIEVFIKDERDEHFRVPIGTAHPRYWKLKRLDSEQARVMQIRYSGLTQRQLRRALKEFEQMPAPVKTCDVADFC
ncbi:hypothetical protein [Dyadobacter sp. NIV53]|uniref:hypothetical protein n=1 Tax=Dyadobacter sp. NIV53 TaxID=2861765 RepID=UPI001C87AC2D|nr:hypothetical protein [Dyadobacter sp. NIV53]